VGKSTLFNALTRSTQADAQNYPFCTIDPNVGIVDVPDERLQKLAKLSKSAKIIPAIVEFVDIAGLVKGASKGEGLGNQFLAHIREVDALVQVVREFKDDTVIHVAGKVDPVEDKAIINLELALADLSTVARVLERTRKETKSVAAKEIGNKLAVLELVHKGLEQGKSVRDLDLSKEQQAMIRDLHLLSAKPMLYVLNVDEAHAVRPVSSDTVVICARLEAELTALSDEEAAAYLHELGLEERGLDRLVKASYALLNLITYFTTGETETRAWTITSDTKAPQASGVIHTDFEKGFIKAEVISYVDFIVGGGELGAKEKGKFRIEGKEYIMQDGDVCHFRFNT